MEKENIIKVLKEEGSIRKAALKFGISYTALRYWIKKYDIANVEREKLVSNYWTNSEWASRNSSNKPALENAKNLKIIFFGPIGIRKSCKQPYKRLAIPFQIFYIITRSITNIFRIFYKFL